MHLSQQLAQHFRQVFFGGNWTAVNLKDTVGPVSWQQAIAKLHTFNTIAALVFHIHYYIKEVAKVLEGAPLTASDRFSFDVPLIQSDADWKALLDAVFSEAERFAQLMETVSEAQLRADFSDGKYGSYYRNLQGIIEHTHYHLGQIVLIKKMLAS